MKSLSANLEKGYFIHLRGYFYLLTWTLHHDRCILRTGHRLFSTLVSGVQNVCLMLLDNNNSIQTNIKTVIFHTWLFKVSQLQSD